MVLKAFDFLPGKTYAYFTLNATPILQYLDAVIPRTHVHAVRKPMRKSFQEHYYSLQNGWECVIYVIPEDDSDFDYDMLMHGRQFDDFTIEPRLNGVMSEKGFEEIVRRLKPASFREWVGKLKET